MKRIVLAGFFLILFACAPVLNKNIMEEAARNPSLTALRQQPEAYQGKLFVLGGVIVNSKFIENGTQLEIYNIPVTSRGYLEDRDRSHGRFLAVYPADKGLADPVVFKKGRQVTLAGVYQGTRTGKIDDIEYVYPVFEIREIHLWEEDFYYPYPYYPYYTSPFWYHPYWGSCGPPPPGWW